MLPAIPRSGLYLVALLVLAAPCVLYAQPMPVVFTDVSAMLDFEHRSSETGGNGLSGVAWLDYDNDGRLDLFIPNGKDYPDALFRNLGEDGFADVAAEAGLGSRSGHAGVIAADFNNDGWTDLFLTGEQGRGNGWFQAPAHLYRNNGDGTFSDVTEDAGIVGPAAHRAASAADVNNDGLLDLFIAGNTTTSIQPNKLYLNNGDFVFTDASAASGLDTRESTCASMFSDYNGDGHQDLFMAPCTTASPLDLFRNNGDGTFTDVGRQAGFTRNALFMGLCGTDYDRDGDIDLFATNYASTRTDLPHSLYRNNNDGTFTDVGIEAGVAFHEFGWGCSFTDFDNDGYDDLFFTGSLDTTCQPGVSGCFDFETIGNGRGNPGTMLFNNGNGTFTEHTDEMPVDMRHLYTSGVVHADFDQNGFSDVVVVAEAVPAQHGRPATSGRPILYRNEGNGNNWITIRLVGTTSNRDAIGARVTVFSGGGFQTKEVYAGSSHLSTESPWLTFGLGAAPGNRARIWVEWPSGKAETFGTDGKTNALIVLEEGTGPIVSTEKPGAVPQRVTLHHNAPNPFRTSTTLRFELSAPLPVTLALYDARGRQVAPLLHRQRLGAGMHRVPVDASTLPSGVYLYRLEAGAERYAGALLVVK